MRFAEGAYSRLMLGDGLRSAPSEALFARSKAAHEAGELYKAFYLARLLNQAAPDLTGAWSNTAALAEALGLPQRDVEAYRARAEGKHDLPIPSGLLPGAKLTVRPSSLGDWAAAMSLLADGTASVEGPEALVALVDTVSGIQPQSYVSPLHGQVEHFALPAPIRLEHVLPNVFALRDAKAMSKKGMGFGGWMSLVAGAALSYAAVSNAPYMDPASLAQTNRLAASALSNAFAVNSDWQKGLYITRNYSEGQAREVKLEPKTAGKYNAVNLPVPVLIASGGSLRPSVRARLGDKGGSPAKEYAIRYALDDRPEKYIKRSMFKGKELIDDKRWKEYLIPDLAYPRLAALYFSKTTEQKGGLALAAFDASRPHTTATALEMFLLAEDIEALVPDAAARSAVLQKLPELTPFREAYRSADAQLSFGYHNAFAQRAGWPPVMSLLGFEPTGTCYAVTGDIEPGAWLIPASRSQSK